MTNTDELGMFYTEHREKLVYIAHKYLRDYEQSDSAVSHVFTKILENKNSNFDINHEYALSWVIRCLKNYCIDVKRKKSEYLIDNFNGYKVYEENKDVYVTPQHKKMLSENLYKLSERRRKIIIMYYKLGMKHKDIAGVLGLKTNSVGVEIKRALSTMRKEFNR
jgi:RNA polymerase sigma factor (sigma-70 family)